MSARRAIFEALVAGGMNPVDAAELLNAVRDEALREDTADRQADQRQHGPSRVSHLWVAAQARLKPGEWLSAGTYRRATAASLPSQVRRAVLTSYRPAGSFEARIERAGGAHAVLQVRFVGSGEACGGGGN
ncbi:MULTISPECIES: hypothetical protein [Streptomyces]|uniref:hypothetical protein n=1 Tax=Streptomyces TaxID=1883 RepID=UPI00345C1DBD